MEPFLLRSSRLPVHLLLTASADRTARLWNVDTGRVFWDHRGQVNTAVFSQNGTKVATACEDGAARVFETAGAARSLWWPTTKGR